MSPLELVDGRFDKLARELRASRPAVPEGLRNRVEDLSRAELEPRRECVRVEPLREGALESLSAAQIPGGR